MALEYVGIDVCVVRSTADQLAEQYRRDIPPRRNVKVIETNRVNLFECPTDVDSCMRKYDNSGTPLYVVYSEM